MAWTEWELFNRCRSWYTKQEKGGKMNPPANTYVIWFAEIISGWRSENGVGLWINSGRGWKLMRASLSLLIPRESSEPQKMRRPAIRHKIYPAARRRIIEIWQYTDKTWGEKQADTNITLSSFGIFPKTCWVLSTYYTLTCIFPVAWKRIWTNNILIYAIILSDPIEFCCPPQDCVWSLIWPQKVTKSTKIKFQSV